MFRNPDFRAKPLKSSHTARCPALSGVRGYWAIGLEKAKERKLRERSTMTTVNVVNLREFSCSILHTEHIGAAI